MGRLHKDARQFLSQYRRAPAKIPVALFVSRAGREAREGAGGSAARTGQGTGDIPVAQADASKIVRVNSDANRLGFPFKFIAAMQKNPLCNARDGQNIRRWAEDRSETLQPGQVREVSAQPIAPATRP